LLAGLLQACPRLLIGPKPARIPPRPFILIAAVIETNDPRLADTILSGLKNPSIDIKLAAVHGIRQCASLHTPEVKQELERLMATKSIAKDVFSMEQFRGALRAIEDRLRP
jgi:hypothetical protein